MYFSKSVCMFMLLVCFLFSPFSSLFGWGFRIFPLPSSYFGIFLSHTPLPHFSNSTSSSCIFSSWLTTPLLKSFASSVSWSIFKGYLFLMRPFSPHPKHVGGFPSTIRFNFLSSGRSLSSDRSFKSSSVTIQNSSRP